MEKIKPITNSFPVPEISLERGDSPLASLLRLFPRATRMDVSIQVGLPGKPKGLCEKTRVLFGFCDAAVFRLGFPVICGTTVLVRPHDGAGEVPATVVAAMPDVDGVAVAVRFHDGKPAWLPQT